MGKIVTVHGTFSSGTPDATDPATGHWWQRNSIFHETLLDLVHSDDGQIVFLPFVWSGANNEAARWEAGRRLAKLLKEPNTGPYCIVGHSHGGSVAVHAVRELAQNHESTTLLSKWITVGTPFVEMKTYPTLYLRSTAFGRLLILIFGQLCVLLLGVYFNSVDSFRDFLLSRAATDHILSPQWLTAWILAVVGFLGGLLYVCLILTQPPKMRSEKQVNVLFSLVATACLSLSPLIVAGLTTAIQNRTSFFLASLTLAVTLYLLFRQLLVRGVIDRIRQGYQRRLQLVGDKWLSLTHPHDEAIAGLSIISQRSFGPFKKGFLTTALSPLSLVVLGSFILVMPFSDKWLALLEGVYQKNALLVFRDMLAIHSEQAFRSMTWLQRILYANFLFAGAPSLSLPASSVAHPAYWPFLFVVVVLYLALFAAAVHLITIWVNSGLSMLASMVANRAVGFRFKQAALGGDSVGEYATRVSPAPSWIPWRNDPLEGELVDEISQFSDTEAIRTIPKLRQALGGGIFIDDIDVPQILAEHLSWKEMIHTSYFNVARFRKLVAFAICQSPGFQPTDRFKEDPDFELVGRWYERVQARVAWRT